MKDAMYNNF